MADAAFAKDNGDKFPFKTITSLPPTLYQSAVRFKGLINKFCVLDNMGQVAAFDWAGLREAAQERGVFISHESDKTFMPHPNQSVDDLADEVFQYIRGKLSTDIPALKLEIVSILTNLKHSKESGFAWFQDSTQTMNSGYLFNILFATVEPDVDDCFSTVVITIKVEAEEKNESWWWGLEKEHSAKFSCHLKGVEFVVKKDFKDSD